MDVLTLSRIQFGSTAAFHILWPLLSIGLGLYLFVLESLWLKTKNDLYYRQVRFWARIFVLTFVIGTVSGIPLEFEFGTNWAAFSTSAGDFFGNILGFESTIAFALEAAFLGIFIFGWKRVPPLVHLFSNAMVAFGATLSAFWIMVANSWMQIPMGVMVEGSKIIVTDYYRAIFNPGSLVGFAHMTLACIATTLFFVMGISAIMLLRKIDIRQHAFFLTSFRVALAIAVVVIPLQMLVGDMSGRVVEEYQPAKLAALELHWNTNSPGTPADWSIIAWPNAEGTDNAFALSIPAGLSLITTHSLTGEVQGLNSFEWNNRPNPIESTLTFYSFRIMVAIGIAMFVMMLAGVWYWKRGYLDVSKIQEHTVFWRLWIFAIPLGFIATEAGWMVREIGRQPWVIYHLMRTSHGLSSNLTTSAVTTTSMLFGLFYTVFISLFVYFTARILRQGPDLDSPPLVYTPPMKSI